MSETRCSNLVPAGATIVSAIISAYALISVNEVKSNDLGSLEKGQKICVVAETGVWHNITIVPKDWTVSMCNGLIKPFEGNAYYIGCAFRDKTIFSAINNPTTPSPNCGW